MGKVNVDPLEKVGISRSLEKNWYFLLKKEKRHLIKCHLHGCPCRQKIEKKVCKGGKQK